jgi:3-deoxy-manno-octulosonate cytidylyltransferase (CMP-KDO synthetase)
MATSIIVIPARYQSSRFPGKPLTLIAGKTLLQRVYEIACAACASLPEVKIYVATDDDRIQQHAQGLGAEVVMTDAECKTGSDRALATCLQLTTMPEIVVNLQGDAPLTPPHFVAAILTTLINDRDCDVATPVAQLSWQALDDLRNSKSQRPFSGTTAIVDANNNALWFSKQIIPAMREEEKLRQQQMMSPIFRHIGLYGYRFSALEKFVALPEGRYEALEGLEQLRFLEQGMKIKAVKVDYGHLPSMSGVDTPEDAQKAENLLLAQEAI